MVQEPKKEFVLNNFLSVNACFPVPMIIGAGPKISPVLKPPK